MSIAHIVSQNSKWLAKIPHHDNIAVGATASCGLVEFV